MTELLHLDDNYLREFDATVTKVDSAKPGLVLDKTAFYPEGGGQVSDRGLLQTDLGEITVKKVKKKSGEILHTCAQVSFDLSELESKTVHGVIDWEHRHTIMRFHTAQHVLSRVMKVEYGAETAGNAVKSPQTRIDFAPFHLDSQDQLREIEGKVNAILDQHLPVKISFMPREEAISFLKEHDYQYSYLEMVPKTVLRFRIIVIGEFDFSACAGTHVANTEEIGKLKIVKTVGKGAGKTRFYYELDNTD